MKKATENRLEINRCSIDARYDTGIIVVFWRCGERMIDQFVTFVDLLIVIILLHTRSLCPVCSMTETRCMFSLPIVFGYYYFIIFFRF